MYPQDVLQNMVIIYVKKFLLKKMYFAFYYKSKDSLSESNFNHK